MKKMSQPKGFLKAAVAIAIALAFITMPGASVFANTDQPLTSGVTNGSDWVMQVENTSANPGDTDHVIYIMGTWPENITGFQIGMRYDPEIIEIVDLDLVGTVAEFEVAPGFYLYWSHGWTNYLPPGELGYFTFGAVETTGNPDFIVNPGSGNLLRIIVNVNISAPGGDSILDLFEDLGHSPAIRCAYGKETGSTVPAKMIDGKLTVSGGPTNQ